MMDRQLALDIQLKDVCSFGNFIPDRNQEVISKVADSALGRSASHLLFVWGSSGTGKTHLLQAACRLANEQQRVAIYLPLREYRELAPAVLEGLSESAIVCLDDVDAIAGQDAWERALLTLFEDMKDRVPMIMSAGANARNIGLKLPDLTTRLGSGLAYQLHILDDDSKLMAMQQRARARGFGLPEEVGRYILNRYPRDTHALFGLLDRMDKVSLAEQRRITIPFIQSLERND